ncbi:hypothetical protein TKWG_09500 [Advenella kashmirensis WT001]|uniref:Uncharacterized protein n=1 Tax=Advenella kashmirensis (strain DSM 17095 / LMG 22695 / WT001) TaxID=1036672 RepID=I3UB32_ADVKW|nr:hypothetical protein TKWG_09500 [Advenella kashmirensis WT001]
MFDTEAEAGNRICPFYQIPAFRRLPGPQFAAARATVCQQAVGAVLAGAGRTVAPPAAIRPGSEVA